MKIRAAVAWEAGATLSIEEFDLDDPRDDEILVQVEAVGVCHTDDNARLGRLPVVFPVILGHEGAGTVERVGKDVTKVKPGDRVLFTPDYCGKCEQCVLGKTPYCDQVVPLPFAGTRPDGSPRAHQAGRPVGAMAVCSVTVIQPLSKATRSAPAVQGAPCALSQAGLAKGFSGMGPARLAMRTGAPIKEATLSLPKRRRSAKSP